MAGSAQEGPVLRAAAEVLRQARLVQEEQRLRELLRAAAGVLRDHPRQPELERVVEWGAGQLGRVMRERRAGATAGGRE